MEKEIPQIIHYIWFGNNPKSELILKCINSWKEKMPDWEFREWNESNYDINKNAYIKEAYECKKYAFASDYARFDILYKYGGIYLDTDVEMLKPIPKEFLKFNGFTGIEGNNKIAPGLILAARPKNKIIGEIKEMYDNIHFLQNGKMNQKTVVSYTTEIFKKYGFIENGKTQLIANFKIFSYEYFCAFDFLNRKFHITKNTISIHHYTSTWNQSLKRKMFIKVKKIINNIIGEKNFIKIVTIKRKIFGIRGE